MTTSQTPWTSKFVTESATITLPPNHTIVSDAAGNPLAWFKDHRDADLVLEEMEGEAREDLRRKIEDLESEVEALEEASAKDERDNEELEKENEELKKKIEALEDKKDAGGAKESIT